MRKGPHRVPYRSEDLERLLDLPFFSSRSTKHAVRAYGPLAVDAASIIVAAAYGCRLEEYVAFLQQGVHEIGEYGTHNAEELEAYLQSLALDLGIVKRKDEERSDA